MRTRRLSYVAGAVNGRLAGEDVEVSSVATDSRSAGPGALFFALSGERTDGHDFVGDAFARGAAGAVVSREIAGGPLVVVEDTGRALLDLAAAERTALQATVIGITGSTGKTCTKDFLASVLSQRFSVQANPFSFNNEVGLPLTILGTDVATEVLILEMGSRGVGHIAMLCDAARPDVGVVTNVGVSHLELFGSRENIARAKGELVEALPAEGVAVLNADDPTTESYRDRTKARVVSFGFARDADVRAENLELDDEARATFALVSGADRAPVSLAVPGEHMVPNALAAAACGVALGLTVHECATGLEGARVSAWRMEMFTTPDGVVVINDAYNASPASMAAALQTARWIARGRRLVTVLGHMAELGPITQEEHERVGALVARVETDRLITVGPEAREIERAAVREGMAMRDVSNHGTVDEAVDDLHGHVQPGDVVLIKASRVAGLERIAESLRTVASRGGAA